MTRQYLYLTVLALALVVLISLPLFIIRPTTSTVTEGALGAAALSAQQYPELNVQRAVPALVIEYFPTVNGTLGRPDKKPILDGIDGAPINTIKDKVSQLNQSFLAGLKKSSIYHGYNNPAASPALFYSVVETKVIDADYPKVSSPLEVRGTSSEDVSVDYRSIVKNASFDICKDYVDNPTKNVRQVWLWTYGSGVQNAEWMFSTSAIDAGNSFGDPNTRRYSMELPKCNNPYVLLHLNYGRGVSEALHSYGHYLEGIFGLANADLFNTKFSGIEPGASARNPQHIDLTTPRHCGTVHVPPNATQGGYDYWNTVPVPSDCPNWDPDYTGPPKVVPVSCLTWSTAPNCSASSAADLGDGQAGWMVYWMQSMPGLGNTLTYQGRKMRNWWEFVADFNAAYARGKDLAYQAPTGIITVERANGDNSLFTPVTGVWMDTVVAAKKVSNNPANFTMLLPGPHTVYVSVPKDPKKDQIFYTYCMDGDVGCATHLSKISTATCLLANTGDNVCPVPITVDGTLVGKLRIFYSSDTTPPVVAITAPVGGAPLLRQVVVTATANDSVGVARLDFLVDGKVVSTASTSPYKFNWDSYSVEPGSHILSVVAHDTSDNTAKADVVVSVLGQVTRSISVSHPASGARVSGVVNASVDPSGSTGITKVEFSVDSALVATVPTTSTSTPYIYSWDTTRLAGGTHIISAKIYYSDAHTDTKQAAVTVVDITPPNFRITNPTHNANVTGILNVTGTATDATGVARVSLSINGTERGVSANASSFSIPFDTSTLTPGFYSFCITATDFAGNSNFGCQGAFKI